MQSTQIEKDRNMSLRLEVPNQMWCTFRDSLFACRTSNEEVIGFLFCETSSTAPEGSSKIRVKTWSVPPQDAYERQSVSGLALRQDYHLRLLTENLENCDFVVHIHTHPTRVRPTFSHIDDQFEIAYARFLHRWRTRAKLISGVFSEDMHEHRFRLWHDDGTLSGTKIVFHVVPDAEAEQEQVFARQQIFGAHAQRKLAEIEVALVGCGGIGAVFAEQLARLGVRNWVLIDPDRVDHTNLNRLPFTTMATAKRQRRKTEYVASLIRRLWGREARIVQRSADIAKGRARGAISNSDWIVVATDNHYSRMLCQQQARSSEQRLLALGTHIDVRPDDHNIVMFARATYPPVAGGWCLMCGGIVDATEAAKERSGDGVRDVLSRAGYLPNVQAPAVYWLNGLCASIGVSLVHGVAAGFRPAFGGVDHIVDAAEMRLLSISHSETPGCYYCSSPME